MLEELCLHVGKKEEKVSVAQLCPTLCDPLEYIACQTPLSMEFWKPHIKCWGSGHVISSVATIVRQGSPNLQDIIPDDLKWSWCNNNRNKVYNKWNALESFWNHPPTPSVEKLSSTKPVPGAKKIGNCCCKTDLILLPFPPPPQGETKMQAGERTGPMSHSLCSAEARFKHWPATLKSPRFLRNHRSAARIIMLERGLTTQEYSLPSLASAVRTFPSWNNPLPLRESGKVSAGMRDSAVSP